jgi:hypothetical protein
MQRAGTVFAIAFGCTLLWAQPGRTESALAVGLPQGNPNNGFVYGYAPDETKAMRYCRGVIKENNTIPAHASKAQKACKIVATFHDQCLAVAMNGGQFKVSSGVGWAVAADSGTAKEQAIAMCAAMTGPGDAPCAVDRFYCDGSAD